MPAATSGSRSKLLFTNFKNFLSKPAITHPQKALTVQLYNDEQRSNMSTQSRQGDIATSANSGFLKDGNAPGEQFEPRQTATSEDYEPDPSKSLKLSPQRQALVDDVRLPSISMCVFSSICSSNNNLPISKSQLMSTSLTTTPDNRPLLLPTHSSTRKTLHTRLSLRRPIRIRKRPLQNGRPMVRSAQTLQSQHQRILPSNPLRRRPHPIQKQAILDLPPDPQNSNHHGSGLVIIRSCDQR